ncbi:MAG: hypothetical protein MAG551_01390 [Candidatus Scalindua arabica]|uniref:GIY-YIG domain-containing protein n=1 Tax=Candidatus Scalindua arabica TaxID=1127984 RepID=A0A942A4W7_9BACT|nr:hypothetical protein [Candidatus Scalindua arabica]
MSNREFGYLDNPANGLDIIRARTLLGNLRLWDIPKSEEALEIVINEIGNSPIPGIYMLFDERSDKKVYIGQSEDLKNRLATHVKSPDDKIKNWERVIIINDARNASQSDLNDENIRLNLENYLISLFKINRYKVTTFSSRTPSLSATQKALVKSFKEELVVLLTRKSKITKVLTERGDDEVYNDEVKKILKRKKYKIDEWGKVEAVINGMKTFIRAGSSKPKGWQVTFRGNNPDSFKTCLEKRKGYLLMPRGPILLIPLKNLKDFILKNDKEAFDRDTIDIFVLFDEEKIFVVYKNTKMDITTNAVQTLSK